MKKVFFYSAGNSERAVHLENLINQTKDICYCEIKQDESGQIVGYLAGYPGYTGLAKERNAYIPWELLLLDGFSDEDLTLFLQFLRGHFFYVERKAVITKQNQSWRLCDLAAALEAEHKMIRENRK